MNNKKMYKKAGKKMMKKGGKSSFGMLSVKAGYDNNPNPTAADRIVGAKKGKMKKGGKKKMMSYGMGGKKKMGYNMGGMQQTTPPAASFIEPPIEQPFANQQAPVMQNPAEFTAKKGGKRKKSVSVKKELKKMRNVRDYMRNKKGGEYMGNMKYKKGGVKKENGGEDENLSMRDLRRKQREERREARRNRRSDRKADREAVKTLKRTSRLKRRDRINDAGEETGMTRSERRMDRRATRRASRTFRKQERQARRTARKDMRSKQRSERSDLRTRRKAAQDKLTQDKLNKLNESESSSVKKKTKPVDDASKVVNNTTTTKKTEDKKTETKKVTNHGVSNDMSFSKAFRTARNSHGGKGGVFTWKGKKYHTGLKEEMKKGSEKSSEENKKEADKKNETPIKQKQKTKTKPVVVKTPKEQAATRDYTLYPGSCFSAGTLITTENGEVAIEDIKVDDMVKTYNEKTKEIEIARVDELFVHEECGDGLIINGSINTTTNHPFYIDGKWVEGKDLKLGDELLNLDGSKQVITSMELNSESQTVYNFEVPGNHNYYAEGVLVHNKMKRGGYRRRGGIK